MKTIQEFHLFAGAGGGILGGMLNKHKCVGASEIDPYCRKVLRRRMFDGCLERFPLYGNILELDAKKFAGTFDILCGGFPCQAFSTASRGRQIEQKNLWPAMLNFVIDSKAPIVFAENVSEQAIIKAAEDLQAIGYRTESCLLGAACLKACHRRNRYWLCAYSNDQGKLLRRINDETSRLPKLHQGIWAAHPEKCGVADEFSDRMDRFRATGNGQVPVVAAVAFRILIKRLWNIEKSLNR